MKTPPKNVKVFHELVRGREITITIPYGEVKMAMAAPMRAKVTSFGTYQDLTSYCKCRNNGGSANGCYAKGDSGIGAWGDITGQRNVPMCALPPEAMIRRFGSSRLARGKKVRVWIDGISEPVICECRDKGPNGVCDLNPAALRKFGFAEDLELNRQGRWEWA